MCGRYHFNCTVGCDDMNIFKTIVLAGAVSLVAGVANAASLYSEETCELSDVQVGGSNADDCFGKAAPAPVNDDLTIVNTYTFYDTMAAWTAEVGGYTGLFGEEDWTQLARSNGGDLTDGLSYSIDDGTFSWSGDIYDQMVVMLKQGNTFAAYLFDGGIGTGGTWESFAFDTNARDLSHMSIYARGDMSVVPLPAAGFLLIGALGGLAMLRRKS